MLTQITKHLYHFAEAFSNIRGKDSAGAAIVEGYRGQLVLHEVWLFLHIYEDDCKAVSCCAITDRLVLVWTIWLVVNFLVRWSQQSWMHLWRFHSRVAKRLPPSFFEQIILADKVLLIDQTHTYFFLDVWFHIRLTFWLRWVLSWL